MYTMLDGVRGMRGGGSNNDDIAIFARGLSNFKLIIFGEIIYGIMYIFFGYWFGYI